MKRTIFFVLVVLTLMCWAFPAYALTTPSPGDALCINTDAVRITQSGTYTITGTGATTNTITVDPNIEGEVNITLSGVHIDVSAANFACAFSIGEGTTVNLTIIGTNILKSGMARAGLHVPLGAVLKIDGTGSLEAAGKGDIHFGPAGIGGNVNAGSGHITINSGTVTAIGGMNGAGIGGGSNNPGGHTTINSGTVHATGGLFGAGIGGGCSANGGHITINGGTVIAWGGENAAGIGGGEEGQGGTIIVSNGKVYATGGKDGAGIGGGRYDNGGDILISGGEVYAAGGTSANDIGAGVNGNCRTNLQIGGAAVVFFKTYSNIALPAPKGNVYVYSDIITGASAHGYTDFPASWEGATAYGFIPGTIPTYTVTFDSGSGSAVDSQTIEEGEKADKPSDPTKSGYLFGGWYTSSNCNDDDRWNFMVCAVVRDITLYAKWNSILTIDTPNILAGTIGESYTCTVSASGGDGTYSWYASGLPSGLSIQRDTGIMSGNPNETGTFSVNVRVYDDENKRAEKTYSLTVSSPSATGKYEIVSDTDSAYTVSTVDEFTTLTINNGYSGFRLINVTVNPIITQEGTEFVVFTHTRNGVQIGYSFNKANFDITGAAGAGFNVQAGDVIKVYVVDELSNDRSENPVLLQ